MAPVERRRSGHEEELLPFIAGCLLAHPNCLGYKTGYKHIILIFPESKELVPFLSTTTTTLFSAVGLFSCSPSHNHFTRPSVLNVQPFFEGPHALCAFHGREGERERFMGGQNTGTGTEQDCYGRKRSHCRKDSQDQRRIT